MWIRPRSAGLQLSPKRADVDLDEVVVVCVVAPHLGQQLILGQGLSAVAHEKREQSKLGRGQRELPTGADREPVFLIDEQAADLQHLRDRAAPAQDSAHARHQFLERKRLDQVIVGAEFESGDPIGHGVAGGEEDDRRAHAAGGAGSPTRSRCRSAARTSRIARSGATDEHVSGTGEIVEPGGGEPLGAKRGEDRIAYRLLVLDHNDSTDRLAHRVSDCPGRFLKIG